MEEQPIGTVREMDAGRTSLTQEVRLVPALVLLKSRTKSTSERKSCAWCSVVCHHQNNFGNCGGLVK